MKTSYSLYSREETDYSTVETLLAMIHPPIQGGNCLLRRYVIEDIDTLSHIGRKLDHAPYYKKGV